MMTVRSFRGRILVTALATGLVTALALFAASCGGSTGTTASSSTESGTSGSIVFSGLLDYPMTFTALDMDYMHWVTITADDPTLGSTEYEGVPLSDIFAYVGVRSAATTVVITAADGSTSEVTLADVSSDALLAVGDDDALSTVMPGMASSAWVKDVVKMEFK